MTNRRPAAGFPYSKPHPHFPRYTVFSDGKIKGPRCDELQQQTIKGGYKRVRLSNEKVLDIRSYKNPDISSLAVKYDVHPDTISLVVKGVTWRHLL